MRLGAKGSCILTFLPTLETLRCLPSPHDYGDFIPGWDFFENFFTRLQHLSSISINVLALVLIISQKTSTFIPCALAVTFLFISYFMPTNGVGGMGKCHPNDPTFHFQSTAQGYTFWTDNVAYNRLVVLFNIAFDPRYRASLIKDGLVDMLVNGKSERSLLKLLSHYSI